MSADACVEALKSNEKEGLNMQEIKKRQDKYGMNELAEEPPIPLWKLVLEQFDDFLVQILLLSAVLSFLLALFENGVQGGFTSFVEPFVILLILILNAIVGVWQESNAANALTALKKMQSEKTRCTRNGAILPSLPAKELVPGDIIHLSMGDKIPADCRLLSLKTTTLRSEESALTGESRTILKSPESIIRKEALVSEKANMLFSGTNITNGICTCIVTSTGMNTEIGKIQQAVMEAKEDEEKTPLNKKIDEFGEMLGKVIMGICVIVWVMNIKQFSDPEFGGFFKGCIYYLKVAVALGVAAIPEGLPAVITLCLSLGTRTMVKRNCIVRKLPSVETLGCTTVICSDKTGTLTTNEMTVVSVDTFSSSGYCFHRDVSGIAYVPRGRLEGIMHIGKDTVALCNIAEISSLCNEGSIHYENGRYSAIGDPTEVSLKVLVEKMGIPNSQQNNVLLHNDDNEKCTHICNDYWSSTYSVNGLLEFSRVRKSMSVLVSKRNEPIKNTLLVKGAPELLISRCSYLCSDDGSVVPMTKELRSKCQNQIDRMTAQSLRCLGFAGKPLEGELATYNGPHHKAYKQLVDSNNFEAIESDLIFYGLCGIKDLARPEVKKSIEQCRDAGIRVFMITGDNKTTAEAIARDVGIIAEGDESHCSYEANAFMALPKKDQLEILRGNGGRVFSRSEPTHKKQLISLLKEMGEITAMTGDGVNDAPALQQADIGVAMGISGTEVAKEASDMVLVDDNFSTIVAAIEEGRSIYQNMKAFIRYLISSNIGEVASIFFTSLLGIPECLSPVQLLWVNLVTDGLPATALGFNPPEPNSMQKPPRDKDEPLISGFVFFRYMVIGLYVGFATVGSFIYYYVFDNNAADHHPLISLAQITNYHKCETWADFSLPDFFGKSFSLPCDYFTVGKNKAATLCLTVLVTIEMFNALNALSEEASLLVMPPHKNIYLVLAILGSFLEHFCILYIPPLQRVFSVEPLTRHDWLIVLAFSFPVIIIDEVLKCYARYRTRKQYERKWNDKKND